MSMKILRSILPLLLVISVYAQDGADSTATPKAKKESIAMGANGSGEKSNELFFHPWITAVSAGSDKLPLVFALTYEHHLLDGKSFIWQQEGAFGTQKANDTIKVSQTSFTSFPGIRSYFNGETHKGFYVQGSGELLFGSFTVTRAGFSEKPSGFVTSFGALIYLGYKWSHVFLDLGGGYHHANGTIKFDDGREVDVSTSGPAIDANIGIGGF